MCFIVGCSLWRWRFRKAIIRVYKKSNSSVCHKIMQKEELNKTLEAFKQGEVPVVATKDFFKGAGFTFVVKTNALKR